MKEDLESGKSCRCKNGAVVIVQKVSEFLYYKFKATKVEHRDLNIIEAGMQESWTSTSLAYHYDCGWSIVEEIR